MASMFESLLERIANLPSNLHQLFSWSPATSSSSSSSSQIEEDLKKLHRRMKRIQALLCDAEEREIRDEHVKLWLDELRDVAYDAEDVLGDIEYELLKYKLACDEGDQAPTIQEKSGISKKRKVSPSIVTLPTSLLCDASFQQQVIAKINSIHDRFNEIYEDRKMLRLREEDGQRNRYEPPQSMPTSCLVDERTVCGRQDDKRKAIDMLLSGDDNGNANVRVASIVGMGGLGKTTLAQLVFDDTTVKNHFKKRLWLCVSDAFEVTRLTKDILEKSLGRTCELQEFDSLRRGLHTELQGKKFLLVLDDVWNENQENWDTLWPALSGGAAGSRVLITTRSEKVSRTSRVSAENMYRLGCLSKDDSWSLFEQRAFGDRSVTHKGDEEFLFT